MNDYLNRAGKTLLIVIIVVGALYILHKWPNKEQEGAVAGQTLEKVADIPQKSAEGSFEDLLDAIEQVESGGDPNAVGDDGAAIGAYQIHKIYVDDVNRIIALYMKDVNFRFTYKDRWDKDKSGTMVGIFTNHYTKFYVVETWRLGMSNNEARARIHNGGPTGWKKDCTKAYWEKVKRAFEGE